MMYAIMLEIKIMKQTNNLPKKAYQAPQIAVLGTIGNLTKTGGVQNNDSGIESSGSGG
jgi:hypothetical protein